MNKDNDYSLLREFNLEKAQAGDEILSVLSPSYYYKEVVHEVKFKGVTSNLQEVFVEDNQGEGYCRSSDRVKMKPLCWIEGKPVYKGDSLYYNFISSKELVVVGAWTFEDGSVGICTNCGGTFHFIQELTWDKPKEPNVYQELIDAYNKGAEIQYWSCLTQNGYGWIDISNPSWCGSDKYRIKPEEKPHNTPRYIQYYPTWQDAAVDLCKNPRKGSVEIRWEE